MKKFVLGFAIGIILLPLAGFFYVWLGFFPVATSGPPLPLEKTIAQMALRARISKEAPKQSPVSPTDANLLAGAKIYRQHCEVCHGFPGEQATPIAKGMYPGPPQFFKGKGVTDDPVGETYWKVSNGIRLTEMPGFQDSLTDEQRWQVSEFLKNVENLPPGFNLKQIPAQSGSN